MEAICGPELWAEFPLDLRSPVDEAWLRYKAELDAIQDRERFEAEASLNEAVTARLESDEKLAKLQEDFKINEAQLNDIRQQCNGLQTSKIQIEAELQVSREENRTLRALSEKTEQRLKDLEQQNQQAQLEAANNSKREKEAVFAAHESSLTVTSLQHKCQSLQSAHDLLEKRITKLTIELETSQNETGKLRREYCQKIAVLQSAKDEAQEKYSHSSKQLDRVKEDLDVERKTLQDLVQEKRRVEEDIARMETQWEAELRAQKRLTDAYKSGEEKYKEKIEKLLAATGELQKQNTVALSQKHDADLELARIRGLLTEKEKEAEVLKTQLAETRELVATPGEERDPIQGLQDRNNVDSRVAALQKDNQLLNHTVRKLTKEMEAVAENIGHHDTAFKRMSTDKQKLEKQLNILNSERDRLLEERDAAVRESTKHRVLAERVEKHNRDLSRQVQCLLAQVENRLDTQARDIPEQSVTDVITNRLVTFTSIRELQEKNTELLSAVRELESIIEERETEDKHTLELESLVSQLQREVQKLVADRDCQVEMVSAMRTQNVAHKERQASDSLDKVEIERLQKEAEKIRSEKDKKVNTLETKLDEVQAALSSAKAELAGVKAELESAKLNSRNLDSQLKTLQVTSQSLERRNATLSANVEAHERMCRDHQEMIASRNNKIEDLENRVRNLQSDLSWNKSSCQSMQGEYDRLTAQMMKQTEVILELQDVKNQLGKIEESFHRRRQEEVDSKERLLEEARKENEKLKEKLNKTQAELVESKKDPSTSGQKNAPTPSISSGNLCCVSYKDQLTKYQVMTKALEQQVNTEKENNNRTQKMLKEFKACLKETKDSNTATQERLTSEVNQIREEATRLQAQKEVAEDKLNKATDELILVRNQLRDTQSQLEEIKATLESSTNQETIKNLENQLSECRALYEKELMAHAKQVEDTANLRARLESAESQRDEAQKVIATAQISSEQEENRLRQEVIRQNEEIASLQNRIEEHQGRYNQLLDRLGPEESMRSILTADIEKEELTSVIEFLRQEQRLKTAELDSVKAENGKLKIKLDRAEADLKTAQQEQNNQNPGSVFLSEEKHAELIRKVELCQVYQESNKMLRQELDAIRSNEKIPDADETLVKENDILKKEIRSWQQRLQKATQQSNQGSQVKELEESLKNANVEIDNLKKEKTKAEEESKIKHDTLEQVRRLGRKYKAMFTEKEKEIKEKLEEIENLQKVNGELQQQIDAEKKKLEGLNREQQLRENTIKSQFEAKWKKQEDEIKSLRAQLMEVDNNGDGGQPIADVVPQQVISPQQTQLSSVAPISPQQPQQQQQQQQQSQQQQPAPLQQIGAAAVMLRAPPVPPTASIRPMSARPARAEPPRVEVHPIQEETPGPSGMQAGTKRPQTSSTETQQQQQDEDSSSEAKRIRTEVLQFPESQELPALLLAEEDIPGGDVEQEENNEPEMGDEEFVLELQNDDASSDAIPHQQAPVVQQSAVVPVASLSVVGTDDGIVPCTPTLVGGEDGATSSFVFQSASSTHNSPSNEASQSQTVQEAQLESNQEARSVPNAPQPTGAASVSVTIAGASAAAAVPEDDDSNNLQEPNSAPTENLRPRRIMWQGHGGNPGIHSQRGGRGNPAGRGQRRGQQRQNVWRRQP